MSFTYAYPRPAATVDCVVFGIRPGAEKVEALLIERKGEPFAGSWALPGGFIDPGENAEEAALRELAEETGLEAVKLRQLYTFTRPGRDPRGWVISVAHVGVVDPDRCTVEARSDARTVGWFDVETLPDLAFDHEEIIHRGLEWLGAQPGHGLVEEV